MRCSCSGLIRFGQAFRKEIGRGDASVTGIRFIKNAANMLLADRIPQFPLRDNTLRNARKPREGRLVSIKIFCRYVFNCCHGLSKYNKV